MSALKFDHFMTKKTKTLKKTGSEVETARRIRRPFHHQCCMIPSLQSLQPSSSQGFVSLTSMDGMASTNKPELNMDCLKCSLPKNYS